MRCMMWVDGKCNSMYTRGLKCEMIDGKNIPDYCTYNSKKSKKVNVVK